MMASRVGLPVIVVDAFFIRPHEERSLLCYANGYLFFLLDCTEFFLVMFWIKPIPKMQQKKCHVCPIF